MKSDHPDGLKIIKRSQILICGRFILMPNVILFSQSEFLKIWLKLAE